ncbi:DUF572-domain-containing protein [Lindgomyces ingoldianus]|uniref:DUF572-domain-containing protein n=1 Tax=Lindgomyces ingoldianus TaxID=673940 RepID=A0ACB6R1B6_9PLEO|nr:DUF572-domain-containing protein [Lindgomyces ingoldianus]KAF2472570.1 DUF572-domain-containing protein [Lindgomyces ingoldianus]
MQGFNMGRYYPPDAESAHRFNTSHPLGNRARKSNQGILIVRFELPFAVWCDHCKPTALVGQGVRFNAEKKKVGNYLSTPIWSFRMKHTACGGWMEIRTDPQNAAYVVTEGGRKRDYGPDERATEGELAFLTEEEREKRRNDAFAALEGRLDDKIVEKKNKERVEELYEASEVWEDPYTVNQKLRSQFRVQRKMFEKATQHKERMQEKFGIGIDIVDEIESDRVRARLVEYGAGESSSDQKVDEASRKPLFVPKDANQNNDPGSQARKLKSEIKAEKTRHNLQQTLVSNTRAAIDPFLMGKNARTKTKGDIIPGLKRKRSLEASTRPIPITTEPPPKKTLPPVALVGYDSD